MSKLNIISTIKSLDPKKLGLKCGLEIHQQLNTGKLFSRIDCQIVPNSELDKQVVRSLRFSKGEKGDIDTAAQEESKKSKRFVYMYNDLVASLVELDEQPPLELNMNALNTVIGVGQMLHINFFPKFQFMRKVIVDGSIPSGFQRTALLGVNGYLETSFGDVSIEGLHLEEDSCRIISKTETESIYSLDRLGIPLIELSTGPDITIPEQAYEVAKKLGNILRSFEFTRRGIGTIRQDLNVSIEGGARVEIKGSQNLELLPSIIEQEMVRQYVYLKLLDEIRHRGILPDHFKSLEVKDVTEIFTSTESTILQKILSDNTKKVYVMKIPNFEGVLGCELQKGYSRFATEVSNRLKSQFSMLKGLFHYDELPAYGILETELLKVKKEIMFSQGDSFIMIACDISLKEQIFDSLKEILKELSFNIPSEVRQVDPKGTNTKYMRKMPGAARMYPETDLEIYDLPEKKHQEIKNSLPELYDKKLSRLSGEWQIEKNKTEEVLSAYSEQEISRLLNKSNKNAKTLYSLLFDLPKDIKKRDQIEPVSFKLSLLEDLLSTIEQEKLSAQIIRDIFISLYKDNLVEIENLEQYLKTKGFSFNQLSDEEILSTLRKIVLENKGAPFGALMGLAMQKFQGNVDGKKLSQLLQKLLKS